MSTLYLSLGTNLGDKANNLGQAIHEIEQQIGKVLSQSAFYVTAPWGFESTHSFLNAALCVETSLSPHDVLRQTQLIEKQLGRLHKSVDGKYSDRLIDIDLLLYDDLILNEEELKLPHPLMTERLFVMEPLAEIAPQVVHPVLQETLKKLTDDLIRRSAEPKRKP
ncbi:MAG: 2-amino-4-hydroxy-6-hydroxymethyldihydropteridine diphosphokinase [Bacteroides sp.]